MNEPARPISAADVFSSNATNYPEPFAGIVSGRIKAKLGDAFGLSNFGVNLTRMAPGAISSLFHAHSQQDEFVYVLEGSPTLRLGDREYTMSPGECIGFAAGSGHAHQLINATGADVAYLEIGDRSRGDEVLYPNDDLAVSTTSDGERAFAHKDGRSY